MGVCPHAVGKSQNEPGRDSRLHNQLYGASTQAVGKGNHGHAQNGRAAKFPLKLLHITKYNLNITHVLLGRDPPSGQEKAAKSISA